VSLTRITTVHCDECNEWEHVDEGRGTQAAARDRRRRGWITVGKGRERRDYCPKCATALASRPTEETGDTPEPPANRN